MPRWQKPGGPARLVDAVVAERTDEVEKDVQKLAESTNQRSKRAHVFPSGLFVREQMGCQIPLAAEWILCRDLENATNVGGRLRKS